MSYWKFSKRNSLVYNGNWTKWNSIWFVIMSDKQKIRWLQGLSQTCIICCRRKIGYHKVLIPKPIHNNYNKKLRKDSHWWNSLLNKGITAKVFLDEKRTCLHSSAMHASDVYCPVTQACMRQLSWASLIYSVQISPSELWVPNCTLDCRNFWSNLKTWKPFSLAFLCFICLRVQNHVSLSLGFPNKGHSILASLRFWHLSRLFQFCYNFEYDVDLMDSGGDVKSKKLLDTVFHK